MTRAPDEIKKDLNDALPAHVHFHKGDPEPHLTYFNYHALECLHAEALSYIQQLEDKVEKLNRVRADLTATNMELRDAVFKQELHMRRLEEERSEFESRVHRWISVEERLPEDCQHVLAFMRRNVIVGWNFDWWHIETDWLDNGDWSKNPAGGYYNITHWMPLPEAPKEDGDD